MERVETLVAEMTLAEKIGQLNMVASTGVVTGPSGSRATHQGIRAGTIGGLFNLWGADEVRAVQRIAVEEFASRRPPPARARRDPRTPHNFSCSAR